MPERRRRTLSLAAPVLVLLVWLCLPTSRTGMVALSAWADQGVFLRALTELQATGRSATSEAGSVGPAYLLLAQTVGRIAAVDAAAALILLNRLAFATVLAVVLTAALGWRQGAVRVHGAVLAGLAAAVLLTPWRLYSDIPWTHPVASAVLLTCVLGVRLLPRAPTPAGVLLGGATLTLAQTRAFEAQALLAGATLLALGLGAAHLVGSRARRPSRDGASKAARAAAGALAGATLAWVTIGRTTGQYALFQQYGDSGQDANLSLDLRSVPVKLVQLFVDPCFRGPCDGLTDYAPQGPLPESLLAYWQQPLLMQLPFLVLALGVLVVLGAARLRGGHPLPADVWLAAVVAAGLVVGYTANPIAGGSHLKYGFVRDFTAPYALLLYAAARTATLHPWRRPVGRRGRAVAALGLVGAVLALVPGQWLPRVGPTLVTYELAPGNCLDGAAPGCRLDVRGRDASGRVHDVADRTVLLLRCREQAVGTLIADGRLPAAVQGPAQRCRADGATLVVQYLPVELGVYQTPDATPLLESHVLTVP